jgi:hypothetical protein
LRDVSCPAPSWCIAVGVEFGIDRVTASTFDGTTWTPLADVPLDPATRLVSDARVDCLAAGSCVVAFSVSRGPDTEPVFAHGGAGAWTLRSPAPGAVAAGTVRVDDVACGSPSACLAVGHRYTMDGSTPLAVGWDGTSWSRRAAPPDLGWFREGTTVRLTCGSATTCMLRAPTADRDSMQAWDGYSWRVLPAPFAAFGGSANDVDCATASACTAVGVSTATVYCPGDPACPKFPSTIVTSPLAATWNGVRWTARVLPVPGRQRLQSVSVSAVSCLSATTCLAMGGGEAAVTAVRAWAASGATWSPANAPALEFGDYFSAAGLSCSSAWCLVIGGRTGPDGAGVAAAYRASPSATPR